MSFRISKEEVSLLNKNANFKQIFRITFRITLSYQLHLALMHLIALHDSVGSGNPLVHRQLRQITFCSPYFCYLKIYLQYFSYLLYYQSFAFMPNVSDKDNRRLLYVTGQTHLAMFREMIIPLPFYAILRYLCPTKIIRCYKFKCSQLS